MGGCIIPQDEEYLSELPIQPNRPVRIVEQQVQPSERIIRGYGIDLCELEFSAVVEDPDVADTLWESWFVDYDPTQPRVADYEHSIPPNNNGKAVRDERALYHPRFNSGGINRLNTPGDHIVEVVVSDSRLSSNREPQPRSILVDGVEYQEQTYTTTYAWFVRTEAGGNCP
ncbi:hypothetical protein DAT35_02245 [Vitiosangium sp. GDMCC 1.1324]|nr:hypothetical protein DAT35_02245 [Vitiosangium sp. GDMCC 1.1324]